MDCFLFNRFSVRAGRPELEKVSSMPTRTEKRFVSFFVSDSNRCNDSGRPTRIALSIRAGRPPNHSLTINVNGSIDLNRSFDSRHSGPIRVGRIQVVRLELLFRFLATRCARLSADSTFWRLAVLDFRLARLFGD